MNRRTVTVATIALLALLVFAAAALLYQRQERQQAIAQAAEQFDAMVRQHSPVIGPANAPVTIVEFFDPACEACRAFYPHVKQILADHPRDVRLVIRYTPFHREASTQSIRILEAARAQGKFEAILDALIQTQPMWANHARNTTDRAWNAAQAAGLDVDRARAHIVTGAVDRVVEQDVADLKALGVRATPTFYVNGKPLPELDPQVLRDVVKSEVERARKKP